MVAIVCSTIFVLIRQQFCTIRQSLISFTDITVPIPLLSSFRFLIIVHIYHRVYTSPLCISALQFSALTLLITWIGNVYILRYSIHVILSRW